MFGFFKKKEKSPPAGPDFSQIDSLAKAEQLLQAGTLEKLFLMPLAFGGEDVPGNILYVPLGVADIKCGIDANIVSPLAAEEKISKYKAEPEYQGKSFVPSLRLLRRV
jgi:hypothetical protein